YVFHMSDGQPDQTVANPTVLFSNAGTYSIMLTVSTPNGCVHNVTHPVTVHPKPNPVFSINNPGQCLVGNQFIFTSSSSIGAGTYSIGWDLGDGTQSSQNSLVHTYTTAGNYTAQLLTVSDKGCKDSLRLPVAVHPMPAAAFTINNAAQCVNGNSFVLSNGSTVSTGTMTYQWNYSDGGSATQINPVYSFAADGPYTIALAVTTDKGCTGSISKPVTVHPKPVPAFVPNTAQQCLRGNSYQFTSSASIHGGTFTFLWHFGDGATSTQTNPAHVYTVGGPYPVRQVLTSDKGCKDSIDVPVNVVTNPVVSTGVTPRQQDLCEGDSLQLNGGGAVQYTWSPGNNLSCTTCASPKAAPGTDQTYYVTGLDAVGCPGADTVV
ncbi:MAG: PKD domain-containing protein, partial [Chitinophagaceae bacterium]